MPRLYVADSSVARLTRLKTNKPATTGTSLVFELAARPVGPMAPQNAARCCRAAHQQLKYRSDGIWISDRILAAEFERYLEASRTKRRMASNVPGPLESRRRLGKRIMAELGIHAESSLPIWALHKAPDLSRWKWEPPTDAASRSERLATREILGTSLWTYLPGWLARWLGIG